jgi:glyoxalase/bleomycin resistance protein/dioxygenase superfamily protein
VIEVEQVEACYQRAVDKGLPIRQALTHQPWGHRRFCVRDPNGLTVYFFRDTRSASYQWSRRPGGRSGRGTEVPHDPDER